MKRTRKITLFFAVLLFSISSNLLAQEAGMKDPESYFGYRPGSDGNLFSYSELIAYLQELDKASPMIKLEQIGASPMGKPMYAAFISSADNIEKLPELKKINHELALNPDLDDATREEYAREGKVFVLATLSMHSVEVGPSQSAPLIAYDLLTAESIEKKEWLKNVVYMMVPCHNPDGMDMIVDNYRKYKGTKYDGASLPDVYHKYVGHDNNRDFVILSQTDTKAIAAIYNLTWFPQVMVEKHQMGSTGVRYFVPPNHDPLAENVPATIFSWSGLFGQNMANDMTNQGLAGVAQHYLFDDYWPGSTETCIWKNVIGFLTEAASARTASPIYIEPNELSVGGKGLSEYKKSTNMLLPWEGGWWRLGDIVDYEIASTMSILKTASLRKEDIMIYRNDICREMVKTGKNEPPYYYILPEEQHDAGELVKLVALLQEHGVTVYTLEKELVIDHIAYHSGDVVVPLAQPFRAFIKEVMESQVFPERHYTPDGELIKPYDITSWSLPLHRHVKSFEVITRSVDLEQNLTRVEGEYMLPAAVITDESRVLLPVSNNESFKAVFTALQKGIPVERTLEDIELNGRTLAEGSFIIPLKGKTASEAKKLVEDLISPAYPVPDETALKTKELEMPRIALVETYLHDMDAGWTRFVFDSYNIPFTKVRPHEIEKADLVKNFDIVIFPDVSKDVLMEGKYKRGGTYYQGNYHPDYTKGMGKKGKQNLLEYINAGGLVISWGQSAALFEGPMSIKEGDEKEDFALPFRDVSADLTKKGLYVPGSLLSIDMLPGHPLTLGLPESTGVFSRGRPVFQTSLPGFDMDRRVIATYAKKDPLLSGYAGKEELIEGQSAMIWLKKGEGQLVLFGFNPQFRASTQGTFKLLFNALLL